MDTSLADKVQYVVAFIAEFAKRYRLTDTQAMRYLKQYNALNLFDKHYDFLHTQSFNSNIEEISEFCRKNGGQL